MENITEFIKNLDVEEHIKNELYQINIENYIGNIN